MSPNIKKQVQLLNQILEKVSAEDEKHKLLMMQRHEASKSTGESWTLHHLKALKNLIING